MRLSKRQLINLINQTINENTRQDPKPPEEPGSSLPIASYLVYPTLTKISNKQKSYLEKTKGFLFGEKDYLVSLGLNLFWITTYFDENTFDPGTADYIDYKQKSYRGLKEIYKTQHGNIFNNFNMTSRKIEPTYPTEKANKIIENMVTSLNESLGRHFSLLCNPKVPKYVGDGKNINYSNEKYQLLLPYDLDQYFNPTQTDLIQRDLKGPMKSIIDKDFENAYRYLHSGGESKEQKPWISFSGEPESIKPDELYKYFKIIEGNFPKFSVDENIKELL